MSASAMPTIAEVHSKAKQAVAVVSKCGACGRVCGVPSPRCPFCGSAETEIEEETAAGRLLSHTVIYVAGGAFTMYVPYAYVLVELDSGARVSGWVLGEEIEHLKPDGRLRAVPHDGQGLQFVHT